MGNRTMNHLVLLIAIFSAMQSCNALKSENVETIKQQYYAVEPNTLLESIAQGKEDAFILIDENQETTPLPANISAKWSQDDFLGVAEALHKVVWGEPLMTWNLFQMDFRVACTDAGMGFDNAHFVFYKVTTVGEQESRFVHEITIEPNRRSASIWEREYSPKLVNWPIIDLEKVEVSADQAVRIAEAHSGDVVKATVKNPCNISAILAPAAADYHGWKIVYTENQFDKIFDYDIDPFTGDVR